MLFVGNGHSEFDFIMAIVFVWKSGFVYWDSKGYRNDRVGGAVFLFVLLLLFVCF